MDEEARNEAVKKERMKLNRQLKRADVSKHKMKALESVIENVAVMKVRLDEFKDQIIMEDLIIEYDNGGGQKGIRENPVFKRYESLFKTFMQGMSKILDVIPDYEEEPVRKSVAGFGPQTVLDAVLEKHKEGA